MKKVKILDLFIILLSLAGIYYINRILENKQEKQLYTLILAGVVLIAVIDFIRKSIKLSNNQNLNRRGSMIYELLLIDDDNKAIKKWDLKGKISLIIGRNNDEEVIDIDLSESEYEGFIDYQHALLNYAGGNWYIEDLYSKNGIRIRKQLDGACYKLSKNRPCRLEAGDVIMIANTKLLLQ